MNFFGGGISSAAWAPGAERFARSDVVLVHQVDAEKPTARISLDLSADQLGRWAPRLFPVLSALVGAAGTDRISAYGHAGVVAIEFGPKQRPLVLVLERDAVEASFRPEGAPISEIREIALPERPSAAELISLVHSYRTAQWNPFQMTSTMITTSGGAFAAPMAQALTFAETRLPVPLAVI